MYDSIIIGAGMSGLAAGIRAAYYDQKVCVLERHYTIGGLNSFYRLRVDATMTSVCMRSLTLRQPARKEVLLRVYYVNCE